MKQTDIFDRSIYIPIAEKTIQINGYIGETYHSLNRAYMQPEPFNWTKLKAASAVAADRIEKEFCKVSEPMAHTRNSKKIQKTLQRNQML